MFFFLNVGVSIIKFFDLRAHVMYESYFVSFKSN